MRIISYILVLCVLIMGVTFAVLNHDSVTVHYYIGEQTLPLSLLLAFTFILGCLLAFLVFFWMLLKVKVKSYRLQQQLKVAEKEIENLRAIPLQGRR